MSDTTDKKSSFWSKLKKVFFAIISIFAFLFVHEKIKNKKKTSESEKKEKVKEDIKVVDTCVGEVKKTALDIVKEAEKAKETISKDTTKDRLDKLEKAGVIRKKVKTGTKSNEKQ